MQKPLLAPDLKEYLDIHQYLQDLYKYRKYKEPNFSYDIWAKELMIKSRSYLRLVVIGKRNLSEEVATLICNQLKLTDRECEYFTNLMMYSQSRSHEQKKIYGRKLMQLVKRDSDTYEVENYFDFLSSPTLPKLQTLLSFDDVEKNQKTLSKLLGTTEKSIEEGLMTLERINMAEPTDDKKVEWRACKKAFKVPDKLGDKALEAYHTNALESAIKAQKLPKELRRFRSLLVALNPEDFHSFLEDLQNFVEQAIARFDTPELRDKRLYQVNFNLFPVSESPHSK